AIFAHGAADEQAVLKQRLIGFIERRHDFSQRRQRRLAAELLDHIFFALGDDPWLPDRFAALADDGLHADRAAEADANHAVVVHAIVADQRVLARLSRAAGHATDQRRVWRNLIEHLHEM